jgi:tetratricopeptide (TPR) repeat protein
MARRSLWLLACLVLAGSALGQQEAAEGPSPGVLLWQQGQEAMRRGQPKAAIDCYEQSLAQDRRLIRNHLSLAAAYLELADDIAACAHLGRYVQANPYHLTIRIHLADLKLRLRRLADARSEFQRCVACAQDWPEPADGELLHCHARLMEIAEALEDSYHEHLHRGIGLALLARQRAQLPDPEDELSTEGLLCKAAGELTVAHHDRPEEARPSWYLYHVWTMLDQRQAARRCLSEASHAAPFSELTAAEKRDLQLHSQCMKANLHVNAGRQ